MNFEEELAALLSQPWGEGPAGAIRSWPWNGAATDPLRFHG